jgi:small subunit ribosomal protein S2
LLIRAPPGARGGCKNANRATTFRVSVRRAVKARGASLGPPARKAGGMTRLPLREPTGTRTDNRAACDGNGIARADTTPKRAGEVARTNGRTAMTTVVTMKQLLESGVHFGHQTRRWNPKMKRYIFTERNGIYIIDLQQSLSYIDTAYEFIRETVAHGGTILYIGTKKQAQEAIAEQARRVGMPYVNQRWLGGMLTNFSTVYKRLQRLKELEELDFGDVAGSGMTKKELLGLKRERDKLDKTLGGIRDMARVPSAVWVVDTKKEHIAISEARKLGIPVVAILDTNCDPDEVTYPIPGNDDAIRSVALLTRVVADAVADGLMSRAGASVADVKPTDDEFSTTIDEPLPEWERDLLGGAPADAAAPAEEIQESAISDEAVADAEIAAAAPETAEIAEAAAEAAPEDAEAAAADAADADTAVDADTDAAVDTDAAAVAE